MRSTGIKSSENHDLRLVFTENVWICLLLLLAFGLLVPFSTAGLSGDSIFNIDVTHEQMKFRLLHENAAAAACVAAALGGLLCGAVLFRFQQSRSETTILLSLPLTRRRIFAHRFLAGLVYLCLGIGLPMLASVGLNLWALGDYRGLKASGAYLFLGLLLTAAVSYAAAVLVSAFSGSVREVLLYWTVGMASPVLVQFGLNRLADVLYFGSAWGKCAYNSTEEIAPSLMEQGLGANPVFFFYEELKEHASYFRALSDTEPGSFHPQALLAWLPVFLMLVLAGLYFLRRRKAEYAGIAVPRGELVKISGDGSLDVSSTVGNASVTAPAIGATVSNNNPPAYIANETIDSGFGTIIINGGTINATSDCTGIGGGQRSLGGTIVINGGNITATAGTSSSAGIGCGQDSMFGSILITGGTINATGSNAGAGIGSGGMHTDSGIITIKGGDITATGGNYGAGIGGSNTNNYGHGDAIQINIYGGTIHAYGGKTAAGIGAGGPFGVSDEINITGGEIWAYGGAGTATQGTHTSRSWGESGMTMVEDGTQISIQGAGAGIGNGGASFSIVNYTSGDKAGTTTASGTAYFGGKISITGGTIHAYRGNIPDEEMSLVSEAGYSYVLAASIGNGGYCNENITDDYPYEEVDLEKKGAVIYEEGAVTLDDTDKGTSVSSSSDLKITGIRSQEYTGAAITPEPTVTLAGAALTKDKDYTVSYADNTEIGTATITVTVNNVGSWTGTFEITEPKVTATKIGKIAVGKKRMKVTVKTVDGATGYKVYYRAKGTKKWKSRTAGADGKLTIKSLKKGKVYQVKVVSLKQVGGKTFTSSASQIKSSKKIK